MLYKWGKPVVFTVIPLLLMLVAVSWAMVYKLDEFWANYRRSLTTGGPADTGSLSLFLVGACILGLTAWLVIEGIVAFARFRRRAAFMAGPERA